MNLPSGFTKMIKGRRNTWSPLRDTMEILVHWAGVTQSPYASMTWLCCEHDFPTAILVIWICCFLSMLCGAHTMDMMEKGPDILHPKSPSSVSRHLPLLLSFPQREERAGWSSPDV
ncbi:hypothetical protein E2320_011775 [Naja naja]|nr:hypothetical protein E2320_011775 [Naja naja]